MVERKQFRNLLIAKIQLFSKRKKLSQENFLFLQGLRKCINVSLNHLLKSKLDD